MCGTKAYRTAHVLCESAISLSQRQGVTNYLSCKRPAVRPVILLICCDNGRHVVSAYVDDIGSTLARAEGLVEAVTNCKIDWILVRRSFKSY